MEAILERIVSGSAERKVDAGDYVDDEGFLCCGKCHTRKERNAVFPAGLMGPDKVERKVPCTCKCEQEADEERRRQEECKEKMVRIQRIRDASMICTIFICTS